MNPGNQSKVYRNLSVIFNCIHLMKFMKFSMLICDTRGDLKTRQMSLPAFLFSYILQCICFKILLTESRYFISNWNYPRLSHKCFLYPNKQCLHDATHLIKGCFDMLSKFSIDINQYVADRVYLLNVFSNLLVYP